MTSSDTVLSLRQLRDENRRALSRWLTAVDQNQKVLEKHWDELWSGALKNNAPVVGLAGPPGAGKSTLLGAMVPHISEKIRVLILCIDPASPLTGGALLGDRVRIFQGVTKDHVFVRSVSNHDIGDSTSTALDAMILVGLNAGFDLILIEGVGSGQADTRLRDYVDFLCLLMVPESGDVVQVLKAGISELADVIILNKADRPGAALLWQALQDEFPKDKLFKSSAESGDGVMAVFQKLQKARATRERRIRSATRALVARVFPNLERAFSQGIQAKFKKDLNAFNPYDLVGSDAEKAIGNLAKSLLKPLAKS